jgi:hypothetical protein
MTIAICIKCGTEKIGALTSCPDCGFEPHDNEDRAKAMVLTDHWLPPEELGRIGVRIQSGLPVDYPEEMVEDYIRELEENPPEKLVARRLGGCAMRFGVGAAVATLFWWFTCQTGQH